MKLKSLSRQLIDSKIFELFIVAVILTNCILIGVETYGHHSWITHTQHIILGIFTFEILTRFIGRESLKSFFSSGWNIFDLSLVLISYIPESMFSEVSEVMLLRVLRVFRILRLLRTSPEIKLIVAVLSKSFSALFYNGIFFFIFLYLFSVIGVSLFHMPAYDTLDAAGKASYELYMVEAPNMPQCAPDPYGDLSESMFTLFRILTSDSWSTIRYNLIVAHDYGLIKTSTGVITAYHVIWFILSAFLLLNLIVGAIVNNYQVIMEDMRRKKEQDELARETRLE